MIILPIEIFKREARPIAFLASIFVKHGFPVLLGDQRLMQSLALRTSSDSLYVDKCLSPQKTSFYKRLPESVRLISHDVEFTGAYRGKDYLRNRYSKIGIERSEFTIFHDIIERDYSLSNVPEIKPFEIDGSWYFESMKADQSDVDELNKIRNIFSDDYVFVPSNFGGYFRKEGFSDFNKWIDTHFTDKNYRALFKEKILYREKERNVFIYALKALAKRHPDRLFVLRPHPTESIEAWLTVPFPRNVTLSTEFTTRLMTIGASSLLHNGCTTGIDANLLDKPQTMIEVNPTIQSWGYSDYVDQIISCNSDKIHGDLTFALNPNKKKLNKSSVCENLVKFCESKNLHKADNISKIYTISLWKSLKRQNTFKYSKLDNRILKEKIKNLCPKSKILDLDFGLLIW